MDISFLSAFVSVAELGSFSRAAESLHLSQPAVSKRIAALESDYNQRLFDRVGRTTRLTEAGQALLPFALQCLSSMEDARRSLSTLSDSVSGSLKLGTSHHIGLHRLPPILREFTRLYPTVELDIHFMDSEVACQAVEQGKLELAIVTLPDTPAAALHCVEVWPDPLAAVIAADHPYAAVQNPTLETLLQIPAVLPDERTFTHRIISQALQARGMSSRIRLTTNYLETLKMLVGIGLGWSVLPLSMADSGMQVLNVSELRLQRRLGTVVDRRRSISAAGEALIKIMTNTPPD